MEINYSTMKKEDLIEALKGKDTELETKGTEIEDKNIELESVKSDIDSLKEMFAIMQKSQEANKQSVPKSDENNDIVKIGSCLTGLHILCDNQGNEIVELQDFGDVASVPMRILDTMMTSTNKELFRKGLVFFLDSKYYLRYSLRENTVLTDETFDKMYALPIQDMFIELDKLTDKGNRKDVTYMIYWKIVKNIASGRKGFQDRNREIELSTYFKTEISNSINGLEVAKQLNFK